jgi:ketosteroid isomerase-like protein
MHAAERTVVEEAYAAWAAGDLESLAYLLDDDIEFSVGMPRDARSYIGEGRGKSLFVERLALFLQVFDVLNYRVKHIDCNNGVATFRIHYHYRDKLKRLEIDGSMRHDWEVVDGKITRLEVIHDAKRMSAFFELVELERSGT